MVHSLASGSILTHVYSAEYPVNTVCQFGDLFLYHSSFCYSEKSSPSVLSGLSPELKALETTSHE